MNVLKFAREVKAEAGKVTWPSLKDVRMLSLMVFVLVFFFAVYLWLVDFVLTGGMKLLIGA